MGALAIGVAAGAVCYGGVHARRPASATTTRSTRSACTASAASGARSPPACSRPRPGTPPARSLGAALFSEQAIGAGATAVYSLAVTFVLLKVLDAVMGLRVDPEVEREGLDVALHGEQGYVLGGSGALSAHESPASSHPVAIGVPAKA